MLYIMSNHKLPIFPLRIPPKLRSKLEEYCEISEKSKTEVVLEAIRKYLEELHV